MILTKFEFYQEQQTTANRVDRLRLSQWQDHYIAETVDLRYFFHSGWSS
ncbi:hypothetical protein O1D97_13660 [Marinomonas sp. 15G1-11]|uniref:Uncharacterized protein n=1 Tax=Marinomonas phaeophyticola TaxID=3004091 RepID=A0ABT4JXW7_9GAMM|nr:hypothetical protein [Marinomonas sp. 15G1-11]MCZ2722628.1 hypothetical protein [Marinomonas sp. 15G1-11]